MFDPSSDLDIDISTIVNESNLLYRAKNYEIDENVFSEQHVSYDKKFMYELYRNKSSEYGDFVVVAIQSECFSCSSIEPIYNFNYEDYITGKIIYVGTSKDFYNIAINNLDLKLHSRSIDKVDVDYNQVSIMYKNFIENYNTTIE